MMLLTQLEKPFNKVGYAGQFKYDGERVIAIKKGNEISLINRGNFIKNNQYPEIVEQLSQYKEDFVIDGEVHTNNQFNLLAKRSHLQNERKIERLRQENPVTYTIFDCMGFDNVDISNHPYLYRYDKLGFIQPNSFLEIIKNYDDCIKLFELVKKNDFEGIVIRDLNSLYTWNFRSHRNYKVKNFKEQIMEFQSYEQNNKGLTLTNKEGYRVQCAGQQSERVLQILERDKKVKCLIQFLQKTKDDKYRFSSFRGIV